MEYVRVMSAHQRRAARRYGSISSRRAPRTLVYTSLGEAACVEAKRRTQAATRLPERNRSSPFDIFAGVEIVDQRDPASVPTKAAVCGLNTLGDKRNGIEHT